MARSADPDARRGVLRAELAGPGLGGGPHLDGPDAGRVAVVPAGDDVAPPRPTGAGRPVAASNATRSAGCSPGCGRDLASPRTCATYPTRRWSGRSPSRPSWWPRRTTHCCLSRTQSIWPPPSRAQNCSSAPSFSHLLWYGSGAAATSARIGAFAAGPHRAGALIGASSNARSDVRVLEVPLRSWSRGSVVLRSSRLHSSSPYVHERPRSTTPRAFTADGPRHREVLEGWDGETDDMSSPGPATAGPA